MKIINTTKSKVSIFILRYLAVYFPVYSFWYMESSVLILIVFKCL